MITAEEMRENHKSRELTRLNNTIKECIEWDGVETTINFYERGHVDADDDEFHKEYLEDFKSTLTDAGFCLTQYNGDNNSISLEISWRY